MNEEERACRILSLRYARVTRDGALSLALDAAREGRGLSVFTPGATIAAAAERDKAAQDTLLRGDVLLADGVGCRLAARLCGEVPPKVIPGIALGEAFLEKAGEERMRVFFYGGEAGIAERAAQNMKKKYPHLSCACADGYGDDPIERVCAFSPHAVLVCLGFPRQEEWIDRHKDELSCPCLALGGSFDVWSGKKRRAPHILRRLGLEWLWRTALEPKRWARLFPLFPYFLKCAAYGVLHKRQKRRENMSVSGKL